jgi:hypothetical protein
MKSHDVMELIRSSALDLGPPGHDQLYGFGMIDVNRTLRQLHTEPAQSEQAPPTFGGLLNKFLLRLRFGFE